MTTEGFTALIDVEKRIGSVSRVTTSYVEIGLPNAVVVAGMRSLAQGAVGDFVFIDCDMAVVLGRISEVFISKKGEITSQEHLDNEVHDVEPIGKAQLLATIDKTTQHVVRGVSVTPKIGDGVFDASNLALSQSIETALFNQIDLTGPQGGVAITLGQIVGIENIDICIPPESIFGRHCGVFGATGSGKSWTLATLISEIRNVHGKAIIIDPTGEFCGKIEDSAEYSFSEIEGNQKLVHFPYQRMREQSLLTLFNPLTQEQLSILREAIRSLRLVQSIKSDRMNDMNDMNESKRQKIRERLKLLTSHNLMEGVDFVSKTGHLIKSRKTISWVRDVFSKYSEEVADNDCNFDIYLLAGQIEYECIEPFYKSIDYLYGDTDERLLGQCSKLITRVSELLNSPDLGCVFSNNGKDICCALEKFFLDIDQRCLLISFEGVSFHYNARELLLNVIGEHLLGLARIQKIGHSPVVFFLDEAHQFFRHTGEDANSRVSVDSMTSIAREGRKYGLTTVLSTQRPHDIPSDVLSQIGTFFIHRLTNESDREVMERACGELDKAAMIFIPSLGQGEVIMLGPGIPIPLPIRINAPAKSSRPSSYGPDYQNHWRSKKEQ